ncbi:MAG: diphthine synthase [Candidatus Aenigmarchaeota archaeon]|nr:diphthine synthase [Candidatus Aenigmarchaeota archaeon]
MLYLIGVGLHNEKDLTLGGLETAKNCDIVYMECYTSKWSGLESLEKILSKKIVQLKRSDMEENQQKILDKAKSKKVAVLIPGDPLVATTHTDLIIEAKKLDIKTKVIHAPSIYSAIAESGLFIYKFGKTTTLPFVTKDYTPESPYDTIKQNKSLNLHTLCLLDIKEKMMQPREGLKYLLNIESKKNENVISEKDFVVVLSIKEETTIIYDSIKNLLERNFSTPAVIIIPSKLHFKEKEYLEIL